MKIIAIFQSQFSSIMNNLNNNLGNFQAKFTKLARRECLEMSSITHSAKSSERQCIARLDKSDILIDPGLVKICTPFPPDLNSRGHPEKTTWN